MDNNRFYDFLDAVRAAQEIVGDGLLKDNNAGNTLWDCYNLMEYPDSREDGGNAYWCVSYDGSIGYTEDNGFNVRWDFITDFAIDVFYGGGESRTDAGTAVDYMRVYVNDSEFYAEAPACDDETATYDELKASILEQAAEAGLPETIFKFMYD